MTTFSGTGTHRLIYKSVNFVTGLTVTAYIWNAALTKSALQTFTEVSDGLYYLDYNFAALGVHAGKFYEGGVGTIMGSFDIVVAAPTAAEIMDTEVDNDGTAISLAGALKLCLAVSTGKSSGGGTSTVVFRDIADTKDRVSATVNSSGNRTAVGTRDAS